MLFLRIKNYGRTWCKFCWNHPRRDMSRGTWWNNSPSIVGEAIGKVSIWSAWPSEETLLEHSGEFEGCQRLLHAWAQGGSCPIPKIYEYQGKIYFKTSNNKGTYHANIKHLVILRMLPVSSENINRIILHSVKIFPKAHLSQNIRPLSLNIRCFFVLQVIFRNRWPRCICDWGRWKILH